MNLQERMDQLHEAMTAMIFLADDELDEAAEFFRVSDGAAELVRLVRARAQRDGVTAAQQIRARKGAYPRARPLLEAYDAFRTTRSLPPARWYLDNRSRLTLVHSRD